MTRATSLAVVALLVAVFAVFTALFAVFAPDVDTVEGRSAESQTAARRAEGDLLSHMVLFQRYVEKVSLAAEAGNWPLAAFYAGKIEGNATLVVDGGYVIDGRDVSAIAAEVALPRAAALAAAARSASADTFGVALGRMVDGCNACHARSGYREVRVQRPVGEGPFPSQAFEPLSQRSASAR